MLEFIVAKVAYWIYSVLLRLLIVVSLHIIGLCDCMGLDGLPDVWSSIRSTDLHTPCTDV